MIEGSFIVLEGIDGSGTTTQTERLVEALRSEGLPVHATNEPSIGPVGSLLRQMLQGRVVVPGIHGSRPPSWTTMALLFAADRSDHLESEILPNLMDGVTVVCDRYDYSSVAYQSLTSGQDASTIEWLRALNSHARRPDLTIVLDVSAGVAADRLLGRGSRQEVYEDSDLQGRLETFYRGVERYFPQDRIVHVDADAGVDEVAHAILTHVRAYRSGE